MSRSNLDSESPTPHVTVLMPCAYASPAFLRAALASVFSQTTTAWRLIVVLDGDPNRETTTVLAELEASGDPRVRVMGSASRLVTGALNTGMRAAQTPFVCALHTDDLLASRAIEVLHTHLARYPDIGYFHSGRIHIDEEGKPLGRLRPARRSFTLADFKDGGPVKHLHCWKVESALAIGGMDESLGLHGADDYDFPWSMAEAGCRFQAIPECLYYYRDHRAYYRLTTHVPLDQQIRELTKIFRKHGLTEEEIDQQIRKRRAGYLRQALFLDRRDRRRKEREGFDLRSGWREPCD